MLNEGGDNEEEGGGHNLSMVDAAGRRLGINAADPVLRKRSANWALSDSSHRVRLAAE